MGTWTVCGEDVFLDTDCKQRVRFDAKLMCLTMKTSEIMLLFGPFPSMGAQHHGLTPLGSW